jgi:hypothetical protein
MLDRMNAADDSSVPGAEKRPVPFYGSYASFVRALKALKESGIPKRVTARSLTPLIGDEGPRISTHFYSMGWTDADDKPTDELIRLVSAFGEDPWKATLKEVVERFYDFVPRPWADLTSGRLHEAFLSHTGRDAKVLVSAETFFLSLALECGIELSERLYMRAARAHSEMAKRAKGDIEDAGEGADELRGSEKPKALATPAVKIPLAHEDGAESKSLVAISGSLERINMILALSKLLGDGTLTDEERRAIGITISVLGRTNAA